jgi:hypothetical protein
MLKIIDKIFRNLGRIVGLIILINGIAVAVLGLVITIMLLLASQHANEFKASIFLGDSTVNYLHVLLFGAIAYGMIKLGKKWFSPKI